MFVLIKSQHILGILVIYIKINFTFFNFLIWLLEHKIAYETLIAFLIHSTALNIVGVDVLYLDTSLYQVTLPYTWF